ncbi:MAG: response regulator [Chloroflexi bacterium]|nr:response regulator [Chloroflexota bacterium]
MARILLVDDEPDMVEVWKLFLRRTGHEFMQANDGLEAIDMVQQFLPDLIILDLMMPNASGDTVLGLVRSTPSLARTRVLVVSAHHEAARISQKYKADGFLPKPVHLEQFNREVERLVAEAQSEVTQDS